jgi:hypothetical protein
MYEEQVVSDLDQAEALTARLLGCEKHISELRAEQAELVSRLDRMQVDLGHGYQDMTGWLSATLDVSYQTAIVCSGWPGPTMERSDRGCGRVDSASTGPFCYLGFQPCGRRTICGERRPRGIRSVGYGVF